MLGEMCTTEPEGSATHERGPDRGSVASRPTHTSGDTNPPATRQDEFSGVLLSIPAASPPSTFSLAARGGTRRNTWNRRCR
jgi:hypothetical protein